jgi:hypothetical protein
MALKNSSLFNYGIQITPSNQFISFGTSGAEAPPNSRTAVLNIGYYSLTSFLIEVVRAFTAADPINDYSATADRSYAGGLQNRVTISTSFTYLSIYFSTGNPSNPASLLGFNTFDYTGATSYTGSASSGIAFVPNQTLSNTFITGFNYLPPSTMQKNFGVVNVSASGVKESIVFTLQQFWQVQFQYIMESTLDSQWLPFVQWLIQQREIEWTPDVTDPNTFYPGTLDDPNTGLQFMYTEMLPNFPGNYSTPLMKFRVSNEI